MFGKIISDGYSKSIVTVITSWQCLLLLFDLYFILSNIQLVKKSAHEPIFPHKGAVSQFEKHFGVKYGSQDAIIVSYSKGWLRGRIPKSLRVSCRL